MQRGWLMPWDLKSVGSRLRHLLPGPSRCRCVARQVRLTLILIAVGCPRHQVVLAVWGLHPQVVVKSRRFQYRCLRSNRRGFVLPAQRPFTDKISLRAHKPSSLYRPHGWRRCWRGTFLLLNVVYHRYRRCTSG